MKQLKYLIISFVLGFLAACANYDEPSMLVESREIQSESESIEQDEGEDFYMDKILRGLRLKPSDFSPNNNKSVIINPPILAYSYDYAADRVAKLIYHIGADLGVNYSSSGPSTASSSKVPDFLRGLGYTVPTVLIPISKMDIVNYLKDNYLIYI